MISIVLDQHADDSAARLNSICQNTESKRFEKTYRLFSGTDSIMTLPVTLMTFFVFI